MSILGSLIDLVAGAAQVVADAFSAFRPGRGERPRAATRPVLVLRLIVFAPASYVFTSLAWFLYAGLDLARAHVVTYGLFAAATLIAACLAAPVVHAAWSSHAAALLVCWHSPFTSQLSSVHTFVSSQFFGVCVHAPVPGVQESVVHASESSQFLGVPEHVPPEHWSPTVHSAPSSHDAALFVCWHTPFTQESEVHTFPSSQSAGEQAGGAPSLPSEPSAPSAPALRWSTRHTSRACPTKAQARTVDSGAPAASCRCCARTS